MLDEIRTPADPTVAEILEGFQAYWADAPAQPAPARRNAWASSWDAIQPVFAVLMAAALVMPG